ncbi:MAG: hypothetical protein PHP32_07185 [Candidatus Izemoplasmatales bacterium]|nr:hypothetical protein [Candidatus Izemoplasmatales bacterium]
MRHHYVRFRRTKILFFAWLAELLFVLLFPIGHVFRDVNTYVAYLALVVTYSLMFLSFFFVIKIGISDPFHSRVAFDEKGMTLYVKKMTVRELSWENIVAISLLGHRKTILISTEPVKINFIQTEWEMDFSPGILKAFAQACPKPELAKHALALLEKQ